MADIRHQPGGSEKMNAIYETDMEIFDEYSKAQQQRLPEWKPPQVSRVVQYSCSWILMLLTYSRQSLNFSNTSIVAKVRLVVKMFDHRQVDSSVK